MSCLWASKATANKLPEMHQKAHLTKFIEWSIISSNKANRENKIIFQVQWSVPYIQIIDTVQYKEEKWSSLNDQGYEE